MGTLKRQSMTDHGPFQQYSDKSVTWRLYLQMSLEHHMMNHSQIYHFVIKNKHNRASNVSIRHHMITCTCIQSQPERSSNRLRDNTSGICSCTSSFWGTGACWNRDRSTAGNSCPDRWMLSYKSFLVYRKFPPICSWRSSSEKCPGIPGPSCAVSSTALVYLSASGKAASYGVLVLCSREALPPVSKIVPLISLSL